VCDPDRIKAGIFPPTKLFIPVTEQGIDDSIVMRVK
jgi:hypothetical protein